MAKNDSMRRVVKLDDVRQNNIVLVDLSQNLSGSVFEEEYKKASENIQKIIKESTPPIEDNISCRHCKSRNCSACKHRDYSSCNRDTTQVRNLTKFQSAVPFIGDRGTGKSSTMCSILNRLSNYTGGEDRAAFYLGRGNDKTRFITFGVIDASTLKSSENVMEIILARMLNYLEDMQDNDDFRELYRQIDELHEDLGLVYWKKESGERQYGLMALQRIADSQKTIDNFRKLVQQFTQDISRHKFGGSPCYLVIALDDIDMYQGRPGGTQDSQFALLEHIYSHMRIPGLIVLITYNEYILRRKCNDHFKEVYLGPEKSRCSAPTPAEQEIIDSLTTQFMSKLFPQERRIYLPNYMNVDLTNRSTLGVKPTLDDTRDPFSLELSQLFKGKEFVPVKDFILRLIAHKTGVYFDIAGTKKHFFEPRNLRELGELFQVIASMKAIEGSEADKKAARESNRRDLLEYLQTPFALMHLNPEEIKQFNKLSMVPLVRQTHSLVDQIRRHRREYVVSPEDIGYLDRYKRDRWKYSYGELLHNIYYSTRIVKGKGFSETFYSKKFIHCILGTHSVMMNQMLQMPDSHEDVMNVIGSSVAGRWANEMLPDFYDEELRSVTPAGSVSAPLVRFFNWQIPIKVQDAILNLLHSAPEESNSQISKDQEILSEYLEALVIVGMLFTNLPKSGLKITLEPDLDDKRSPTLFLRSASEDHVCFNVLNFVINLYSAALNDNEYLQYIYDKLCKLGSDFLRQVKHDWNGDISQAEELLRNRSEDISRKLPYYSGTYDDITIAAHKRTIEKAKKWLSLIEAYGITEGVFLNNWTEIVAITCRRLKQDIRNWNRKYTQFPMVLPVQHFDMMYNIIKRLADSSYHDIPEEAHLKDVHRYFAQLYDSVAEELENQDRIYFEKGEKTFSKAFKDNVFYQHFSNQGSKFNPYVRQILTSMLREVLHTQSVLDKVSPIISSL